MDGDKIDLNRIYENTTLKWEFVIWLDFWLGNKLFSPVLTTLAIPYIGLNMIEIITDSQTFDLHYASDQYHIEGQQLDPVITQVGEFEWQISLNDTSYTIFLHKMDRENRTVRLTINGKFVEVGIRSRAAKLLQELGIADKFQQKTDSVKAPMPGLIHSVNISVGAVVKKGDPLLILEAMKMENIIKSPGDGVISKIHVAEKDSVNKNALLVSFE